MNRWGKAGVRLTEREVAARAADARRRRNITATARDAHLRAAYGDWLCGLVVPDRITMALDLRGLHGPEVDTACKAAEPEVDQWEAGERYPSWEQLCALADLTGFLPGFFMSTFDGCEPMPLWDTSIWFHMKEPERRAYERHYHPPIMRYPRAVLDERPPAPAEMPEG